MSKTGRKYQTFIKKKTEVKQLYFDLGYTDFHQNAKLGQRLVSYIIYTWSLWDTPCRKHFKVRKLGDSSWWEYKKPKVTADL